MFRLIEGFDLYSNANNNQTGAAVNWSFAGGASSTMQAGRFGGQALYLNGSTGSNRQAARSLGEEFSSGCLGIALRPLDTTMDMVILEDSSGNDMISFPTRTGHLCVDIGSTEIVRSTVPVVGVSQWGYLECEFVCDDTNGRIKAWWNGELIIDTPANLDTRANANLIGQIRLYAAAGNRECYFDDLYVTDTPVRVGERRIRGFYASADVGTPDFAPLGAGDNYVEIDEITADGDTSYVSGSRS